MKKTVFLYLFVWIIWGCKDNKPTPVDSNVQTLENEQETQWQRLEAANYSIEYPVSWEVDTSHSQGEIFTLLAPKKNGQSSGREKIYLMTQSLAGLNIDIDSYTKISEEQVLSMLPKSTLIESRRVESEIPFHILVYSGEVGYSLMQIIQHFWITGETAYILSFNGEKEKFEQYRKVVEEIMSSFTFKGALKE